MSDDRASKALLGLFGAAMANKKLKEQREATERVAEAQEEANWIASRQLEAAEKNRKKKYHKKKYQTTAVPVKNGYHRHTFANGSTYVGEWKNDKHHGQGTLTSADGSTYVGEFKDGKHHGQVTYTRPNGSTCVGELKDGEFHIQVYYSSFDGSTYVGEWKNDKHHGQGTLTSADGSTYVGEWKNDKYHGQGTLTSADGSVETGIWKNNDLFSGKKKDHNESKIKKHTKSDKQALTIEDELLKIKELYEKDLITEEVYKARQISILESYK